MDDRAKLGKAGEDHAERFLRRLGYRIVTRNYRSATGEIDLVALDTHVIVFVEVKTRSGPGYGGAEAVTGRKLARLRRAAARWLEGRPAAPVRFDVVVFTAAGRGFDMDVYEGVEHGAR